MSATVNVSIIIPAFNQERFIYKCLTSAVAQSYHSYEIIVIDDGSTDNTASITEEFKNIRLIKQANLGTSAAWNRAIRESSSSYLIGLDSDDEYFSETVEVMMQAASLCPEADLLYSNYLFMDNEDVIGRQVINPAAHDPLQLLIKLHDNLGQPNNFLPFGHVRLYKRNSLLAVGGYDESYRFAEDFDLVLRMAEAGMQFQRVDKILYKYRWHTTNKGVVSRSEQKQEVRRSVTDYQMRNNVIIY